MYVWSLPIQQFALFRKRWHRRVSLTVGGVCLFPAGSQWLRLYGPCVPGWAPTLQWIFHKANTKIRVGGTQNWTQISCANDHDGWLYYGRILKLTVLTFVGVWTQYCWVGQWLFIVKQTYSLKANVLHILYDIIMETAWCGSKNLHRELSLWIYILLFPLSIINSRS